MRNINILTFIILMGTTYCSGQNISDVVRWSSLDPMGTSRTMGVGSAFGAMGGDFSVININPAGIAEFRISEFTFTPSLRTNSTSSYFEKDPSNVSYAKKSKLGLDNIGFVICRNLSSKSNWTSSNFAIGYSRIADISRNISLQGKTEGSITTMFAEKANGIKPEDLDEFVAYPAYNTGAIFDINEDNFYETDFAQPDLPVNKNQEIIQQGGINELTLGWAGEYEHKMNLGFSVGVPFASFEELKTYTETDPADEIATFDNLEFTERLNTSGVGINFKAGFTYKPTNILRFGAAFHSPTWYRFTDNYSNSLTYSFVDDSPKSFSYDSQDGTFDYKISNPWRAIGSLGTIYKIGNIVGFVNADVEYLDYTNADYNGTAYSSEPGEAAYTKEVNKQIQARLGTATNVRLGTELGYKNLRFRAGYSWEQSAFNADNFYNNKLSFGFGFRGDRFFMDLGIRVSEQSEGYNPYVVIEPSLDPLTNINTTRTRGALTFGFKF
ncbi:MAG: hypothetical protein IPO92_01745 [Saprospiraceae bacterium]|nr:hypothetical protein [Saprospiraceae bacterium]